MSAVYGLALVMPAWLAALIVGAVAILVGFVMTQSGKKHLEPSHLAPERTMHSLNKDKNTSSRGKSQEHDSSLLPRKNLSVMPFLTSTRQKAPTRWNERSMRDDPTSKTSLMHWKTGFHQDNYLIRRSHSPKKTAVSSLAILARRSKTIRYLCFSLQLA